MNLNGTRWWGILAAALLVACAGEDGERGMPGKDGADAEPCTVTMVDGVATITCPDGTSSEIDPGTCSVTSHGDGTHTIACPDGSTTVVRDGETLPRGTIRGTVGPWRLPGEAGIEVTLVELDRTVTTDAEGRFEFDGLIPGIYRLRVVQIGRPPVEIPNVVVFGGLLDLGRIELKMGRLIRQGLAVALPSPSGSLLAVSEGSFFSDRGELLVVDALTGEARGSLGEIEMDENVVWVGDRFVAATAPGGEDLLVLDLETGARTRVPGVDSFVAMPDALIARASDGGFFLVPLPEGEPSDLEAVTDLEFDFEQGLAVLGSYTGAGLVLVDTKVRSVTRLPGGVHSYHAIGPSGLFAFLDWQEGGLLELAVYDTASGVTRFYGPASYFRPVFSPAGDALVYRLDDGRYALLDLTTGDSVVLNVVPDPLNQFTWADFSPSGRLIFLGNWNRAVAVAPESGTRWDLAGSSWFVSDSERFVISRGSSGTDILDTIEGTIRTVDSSWDDLEPAVGDRVVLDRAGVLLLLDLATGEETELAPEVSGPWLLTPDGGAVFFTDGRTGLLRLARFDGEIVDTGVEGYVFAWSEDGRWFLAASSYRTFEMGDFYLVSADGGVVVPVDEHLLGAVTVGETLFYFAGEIDPADLPLGASGGSLDPFANVGLYTAALP